MNKGRADTLAFALAYVITHSVFLTAFGPLHMQLRTYAPMIPAIMGIVYLVCVIILFMAAFSLFGLIGGGSSGSESVGGRAASSITGGSGPGTKAGDGGPLRVNILAPRDGSFAPLGGRGQLVFEIAGGAKPVVWEIQPPTYVRQARGSMGWGSTVKIDIIAPLPGKQTITVTATDGRGQRATGSTGYNVLAGGTIAGKIVDKTGAPLSNVAVLLTAPSSTSALRGGTGKVELTIKTKDDGAFKFEDVPFNTPLQIRASTSDHEGLVKIPQTGREQSTFWLDLNMPTIENCVVVFPEYEYKKPSVKIKTINNIAIQDKDLTIPVGQTQKVQVVVEVTPGNSIKADNEEAKKKKLVFKAKYFATKEGATRELAVPYGIEEFSEKIDENKVITWKYVCSIVTEGGALPFGPYLVYASIEDDRKNKEETTAKFEIFQGANGFGGRADQPFKVRLASFGGQPPAGGTSAVIADITEKPEAVLQIEGAIEPIEDAKITITTLVLYEKAYVKTDPMIAFGATVNVHEKWMLQRYSEDKGTHNFTVEIKKSPDKPWLLYGLSAIDSNAIVSGAKKNDGSRIIDIQYLVVASVRDSSNPSKIAVSYGIFKQKGFIEESVSDNANYRNAEPDEGFSQAEATYSEEKNKTLRKLLKAMSQDANSTVHEE